MPEVDDVATRVGVVECKQLVALLAALLVVGPAAAQQVPAETVLDTVNASTPVSAYGGVAVWSSFDSASKSYRLRVYRDGRVSDVPVAPRRSPFDADVGPDRGGHPVIVYSRCRKDEPGGLNFNGLPEWAFARGCDVHRFRLTDGTDHVLAVARSTVRSEVTPSIWGRWLAYFAIGEPRHGRRSVAPRLYLADLLGSRRTRSFPGGGGKKLDRFGGKLIDGPSPTSLDLMGTTMLYGWSNLESCATGEGDSGGEPQAAQIWRQALGRRTRLANQCTGYGVFGPFFAGTSARWIAPAADKSVTLASSVVGGAGPLPAYAVGAAIDGPNLIVARGSDTGPTQVVAIPWASSSSGSAGSSATTSAAVAASGRATSFRFVKAPVVAYYAAAGHSAQWMIVARLNKALPTRSDRRPRADLRVDGNPSEAGPSRVGSRMGRACYVASYSSENDAQGSPQLVKPRSGQRVTITLYFNKRMSVDVRVSARRVASLAAVNTHEGIQPYLAQLGCV